MFEAKLPQKPLRTNVSLEWGWHLHCTQFSLTNRLITLIRLLYGKPIVAIFNNLIYIQFSIYIYVILFLFIQFNIYIYAIFLNPLNLISLYLFNSIAQCPFNLIRIYSFNLICIYSFNLIRIYSFNLIRIYSFNLIRIYSFNLICIYSFNPKKNIHLISGTGSSHRIWKLRAWERIIAVQYGGRGWKRPAVVFNISFRQNRIYLSKWSGRRDCQGTCWSYRSEYQDAWID